MRQMKVSTSRNNGVCVLSLAGDLLGDSEAALLSAIGDLIEEGENRFVVDLNGVGFMNSAGLGELVRVTAQVNLREGQLVLTNVSPFIAGVLRATSLDRFFNVCNTMDEALASLT